MDRIYETVRPEALVIGDLVKANGALFCIISFGKWAWRADQGRCEFVTVECVDPFDKHFQVGLCKQLALYPESGRNQRHHPDGGTWERVARASGVGDADLSRFAEGVAVEDAEGHRGTILGIVGAHTARVRWHKGYASIEDVGGLKVAEEQEQ